MDQREKLYWENVWLKMSVMKDDFQISRAKQTLTNIFRKEKEKRVHTNKNYLKVRNLKI